MGKTSKAKRPEKKKVGKSEPEPKVNLRKAPGKHAYKSRVKHLKTFKQISQNGDYPTIEAPNCPNVPRKFCDITGNLAKYRDPKT